MLASMRSVAFVALVCILVASPTSALALLVKMAAVAIAATVVQSYSAQASVVCRLLSHFAHARAARPASLREGMSLPRSNPQPKAARRAWRSAVLQGSADSISTRILLPPRLGTRM